MGKMPEAIVRQRVTQHSSAILRCYSDGQGSAPELAGRAMMRFIIEEDGQVQRVSTIGADFPSKAVPRCLEALFRAIRFPKPDSGSVRVTYPLPLSGAQNPDWGTVP